MSCGEDRGSVEGWRRHQRGHSEVCGKCADARDDYLAKLTAMRNGRKVKSIREEQVRQVMPRPEGCTLGDRGWEVAVLVARDLENPQIAELMGISVSTVKTHVRTILQQLGVARRSGITMAMYRRGWLPADLRTDEQVSITKELFGALARVVHLAQHGRAEEAQLLARRISFHMPPPKTYTP